MNTRHRVPILFSLSMVDVLCCALGCVILLWLVNSRVARQRAEQAGETKIQLDETIAKYEETAAALDSSAAQVRKLQTDLSALLEKNQSLLALLDAKEKNHQKLTDQLLVAGLMLSDLNEQMQHKEKKLQKANVRIEDLVVQLLNAKDDAGALGSKLNAKTKQLQILTGKLNAADKQTAKLTGELKDADKLIEKLEKLLAKLKLESKDRAVQLAKSETKSKSLSEDLASKQKKLDESKLKIDDLLKKLDSLLRDKKALETQLTLGQLNLSNARLMIGKLEKDRKNLAKEKTELFKDKAKLLKKAHLYREALSNRFAGITLTGKRVIFLVDVSGSMIRLDSNTEYKAKWSMICDVIGQIMSSMPDLTHYQVIAFSDKVSYPLGYDRKWLVYDPEHSPAFLTSKLRSITPAGGTAMEPAFAESFIYKPGGLDTIYLISDGLPDPNEIPPNLSELSKVERTAHFCRHIRQRLKTEWNAPVNGKHPVRINTVGFFFESPEVGAFLWALARENDGNFVGMSKP